MPEMIVNYDIPVDHPSLKGHFPGNPVIPGVVIVEKVLRSFSQARPSNSYKIVMAKFLQPLIPPATLTVHISENTENRFKFKAISKPHIIASGIIEIKPDIHAW